MGITPPDKTRLLLRPDVLDRIARAKRSQEAAEHEQSTHSEAQITGITKEAEHLKTVVYSTVAVVAALLVIGWQLFLHLDNKIERKLEAINTRLDSAVLEANRKNEAIGSRVDGLVSNLAIKQENKEK